jgi:cardiolipin synthase
MRNLPNILTLSRIGAIPILVGAFYIGAPAGNWIAFGIFTLATLTDFVDGYLARAQGTTSAFGQALDPIADKLLVAAALLMLTAFERAPVIAVILILSRELLIAGLRQWLAERASGLPVSRLAKWKTTSQMLAIALLLIGTSGPSGVPVVPLGEAFLWLAVLLTWITAFGYLRIVGKHLSGDGAEARPGEARPSEAVRTTEPTAPEGEDTRR